MAWTHLILAAGAAALAPAAPAALHQAGARPAAAPTAPGAAIDELFEAADRGELAPIERALARPLAPDTAALLRAALAAARCDPAAAREPALARLAAGRDPALRRAALSVTTSAAFAAADYTEAARAGRLLAEALATAGKAHEAAAAGRTWQLAALLAGHPTQRLAAPPAPGSIPLRADQVGLPRIDIMVNGVVQDAVVDTGAGLSVLTTETARRLGVTLLDGGIAVGNSVDTTVPVRVGIAARIEIAGNVFTNAPFLIIDDAELIFPMAGGYSIKAIVGLPVLRALGRVRIETAGRFVVLPAAPAGAAGPQNLRGNGDEIYVEVALDGRPVALEFDTGANRTSLTARYAVANPSLIAALTRAQSRSAGAGGARTQQVAAWRNAPVALAGRSVILPSISIALPTDGPPPRLEGTLGEDVLRRFQSYTIDFPAMRLKLGPPVEQADGGAVAR